MNRRDLGWLGLSLGVTVSNLVLMGLNARTSLRQMSAADQLAAAQKAAADELAAANKFAALDKQAAVEQMAGQAADNGDFAVTQHFSELCEKYSWLANTRNSVGLLSAGDSPRGTAVLLDRDGTIALCAHEWDERLLTLNFYPKDNTVECKIFGCQKDDEHDLMFASIDPRQIRQHKLMPVQFGNMGFEGKEAGQNTVTVGFPSPSIRLHAIENVVSSFERAIPFKDQPNLDLCKIMENGPSFPGNSGSAVFNENKVVGIVNRGANLGLNANNSFIPVNFIIDAYCQLYPDRARRAGITPVSNKTPNAEAPNVPEECFANRRDFLLAPFKPAVN